MIGLEHHRHQRARPDSDTRIGAEKLVGEVEDNTEDVLVGEKIRSGEPQSVPEPKQVEEEGVAAQACKKAHAVVARRDDRLDSKRDWRVLNERIFLAVAFEMTVLELAVKFDACCARDLSTLLFA